MQTVKWEESIVGAGIQMDIDALKAYADQTERRVCSLESVPTISVSEFEYFKANIEERIAGESGWLRAQLEMKLDNLVRILSEKVTDILWQHDIKDINKEEFENDILAMLGGNNT